MGALWSWSNFELAREIVKRHEDDEHLAIVFMRGALAVGCGDASEEQDFNEVLNLANQFLMLCPGDGELSYWKAHALSEIGDRKQALLCFKRAADHALNGVVRLWAQDALDAYVAENNND